jgi:hypothetical protein
MLETINNEIEVFGATIAELFEASEKFGSKHQYFVMSILTDIQEIILQEDFDKEVVRKMLNASKYLIVASINK